MVDIFGGLESMDFGLSNAVSDVSLRFLVNILGSFFGPHRKVPKRWKYMAKRASPYLTARYIYIYIYISRS